MSSYPEEQLKHYTEKEEHEAQQAHELQLAKEQADAFVSAMTPDMSLVDFQSTIFWINKAHGWFDNERTFGDDVALIHSEASEMYEAYREHGLEDATLGEPIITDDGIKHAIPKPEGVGSELADIIIRALDTAERHEIDIAHELIRKLQYNNTRSYRHGNKRV